MNESQLPFVPLIILGAARSGTNMLRDTLTTLPTVETWLCDEIDPIWRRGHEDHPDDRFTADMVDASDRYRIRQAFMRIWNSRGRPEIVVEKTCANMLRVPYIARLLPEARFVHLVRDGLDVVPSAAKRWRGEFELPRLPYYMAKLRYTPPMSLLHVGSAFASRRVGLLTGRSRRFSVWGPRVPGLEAYQDASVEDICAYQWTACVATGTADLSALDRPVATANYEAFTADPTNSLAQMLTTLGIAFCDWQIVAATRGIRRSISPRDPAIRANVASKLSPKVLAQMAAPLVTHGYPKA